MNKKIKIFMSLPTNGFVVDSQEHILRELQDTYRDHVEFVYPIAKVRRIFHDFARNMLVEDFLASDCDVMWFLDSDITPNKQILDLIACHWDKWQVAGATYPIFMTPPGGDIPEVVFTCYQKNEQTGALALNAVPKEGVGFVDGLATGCLFIKREVFSQLEKPYFEFKFHPETRALEEGEDLGFCRKLAQLGIKVFTDFTMVCKHQKTVDLLEVNNYAIQYSNRSVLEYDKRIKATLNSALAAQYSAGYQAALEAVRKELHASQAPTIWTPPKDIKITKELA